MGIDIYLEWDGMTEADKNAQIECGFSITSGNVGYLREAYHGGPYATKLLCREAFESDTSAAEIPADILRERLTHVTEPVFELHNANSGHKMAEQVAQLLAAAGITIMGGPMGAEKTTPMTVDEAVLARQRTVYHDDDEFAEKVKQSFHAFVALAEQKEHETGKTCTVRASH